MRGRVVLVLLVLLAPGCGNGEEETPTVPSGTPSTGLATTTTMTTPAPSATVARIEAELLAALEAGRDPRAVGEIRLSCPGSGRVGLGAVFECRSEPFTPSGAPIQSATFTVVVVDDAGTWAASGAGSPPFWDSAPGGLNCDQFFDAYLARAPFAPYDTPPGGEYAAENYLYTVAYFFAQGRPALMDIDGNGVPCETVYPPAVVREVWSGGLVRA